MKSQPFPPNAGAADRMSLEAVFAFIAQHKLMMLATSVSDQPQAAVVEFGEDAEKRLIIFDTLKDSRKYKNLLANPRVAGVIGWDESITVQFEGLAKELAGTELEQAKAAYFAKNPRAQRWESRDHITYFAVTLTWIRYSDLNQDPWYITELTFSANGQAR